VEKILSCLKKFTLHEIFESSWDKRRPGIRPEAKKSKRGSGPQRYNPRAAADREN
jgi:hypothetical protein